MRNDELTQMNTEIFEAVQAVEAGWTPEVQTREEQKIARDAIAFLNAYEVSPRRVATK